MGLMTIMTRKCKIANTKSFSNSSELSMLKKLRDFFRRMSEKKSKED
jgi:hypothetical protein